MPRRGENIRKRKDGRWEGRFIDFYKPDKTPHYKSIYGGTYTEVKDMLQVKRSQKEPLNQPSTDRDVDSLSAEWLESSKVRVKVSTYARYYTILQSHIAPYFGAIPAAAITNEVIENFVKEKTESKSVRPLSPKTLRCIISVLFQIIKYAEKHQYIQPLSLMVELPRAQSGKLSVLSLEQERKLLEYIQGNLSKETLGILIALYTGVRLGELCALTWDSVDFTMEELQITKTVQRIKNLTPKSVAKTRLLIDSPKSEKSLRAIPLPSSILEILKTFNECQKGTDYILSGTAAMPDPRTYQNVFQKHLKAAGLSSINFHAIRHTFATRAIEVEFDVKSLSEILGHASVRFTLDRYVHSSREQKRACMEKMSKCY